MRWLAPHQHTASHVLHVLSHMTCLRCCQVTLQALALGGGCGCSGFSGSQFGTGCCMFISLLRQAFSLRRYIHVQKDAERQGDKKHLRRIG